MRYSLDMDASKWYHVEVTEGQEGGFSVFCLSHDAQGAISQGETLEETFVNIAEAIQLVRESHATD